MIAAFVSGSGFIVTKAYFKNRTKACFYGCICAEKISMVQKAVQAILVYRSKGFIEAVSDFPRTASGFFAVRHQISGWRFFHAKIPLGVINPKELSLKPFDPLIKHSTDFWLPKHRGIFARRFSRRKTDRLAQILPATCSAADHVNTMNLKTGVTRNMVFQNNTNLLPVT